MLTYYSLSAFFNFFASSILGFFVIYKNPKAKINRALFFWCFAVAFWSFFYFLWQIESKESLALLWTKILMLGAIWIPPAYLKVVLIFLDLYKKYRKYLYINYVICIIFSILLLTPLMVDHVEALVGFTYWPKPGLAYTFFLIMFIGITLYAMILSIKSYKNEPSALKRIQIRYILWGIAISVIGGSTNYFLWYDIPIKPYGNILASTYVFLSAYAILRYRLMDIRVIARTILIYFFDSIFAFGYYSILIMVYPLIWGSVYSLSSLLAGIVVAPIFVFLILRWHELVKFLLDKYFFKSLYDFRSTITALSSQLNNYTDLDKIINLIIDAIIKTMGLNRAGVILAEKNSNIIKYQMARAIGFDAAGGISLVKDNFLPRYLKQTVKPLVREELPYLAREAKNKKESAILLNLEQEMKRSKIALCLPLLAGKELLGIIVLGSKHSGNPYTNDDLGLLSTLSNQAAIAIDNARLYAEQKNFNKLLQKKVDEQTKELKDRAEHLEKLLKMREEFLDIASHQLKTPVSVIRGTLSMFKDGSMDKISKEERQKFLDNIYHKTEKLNVIIADILRASEIDTEDFKIDPKLAQKAKLEDILQSVCSDLKELADDKKVVLELNLPKKSVSIFTSADFLEQAIYNLVDNAIKYSGKGKVKIDLILENGEVVIKISDSGIGIPAADQKKIFEKFSRAKNAVNMYTDGSGLGLFIVKRIVEAHQGGSISFKSEEGKGTEFIVRLKI